MSLSKISSGIIAVTALLAASTNACKTPSDLVQSQRTRRDGSVENPTYNLNEIHIGTCNVKKIEEILSSTKNNTEIDNIGKSILLDVVNNDYEHILEMAAKQGIDLTEDANTMLRSTLMYAKQSGMSLKEVELIIASSIKEKHLEIQRNELQVKNDAESTAWGRGTMERTGKAVNTAKKVSLIFTAVAGVAAAIAIVTGVAEMSFILSYILSMMGATTTISISFSFSAWSASLVATFPFLAGLSMVWAGGLGVALRGVKLLSWLVSSVAEMSGNMIGKSSSNLVTNICRWTSFCKPVSQTIQQCPGNQKLEINLDGEWTEIKERNVVAHSTTVTQGMFGRVWWRCGQKESSIPTDYAHNTANVYVSYDGNNVEFKFSLAAINRATFCLMDKGPRLWLDDGNYHVLKFEENQTFKVKNTGTLYWKCRESQIFSNKLSTLIDSNINEYLNVTATWRSHYVDWVIKEWVPDLPKLDPINIPLPITTTSISTSSAEIIDITNETTTKTTATVLTTLNVPSTRAPTASDTTQKANPKQGTTVTNEPTSTIEVTPSSTTPDVNPAPEPITSSSHESKDSIPVIAGASAGAVGVVGLVAATFAATKYLKKDNIGDQNEKQSAMWNHENPLYDDINVENGNPLYSAA